MTIDPELLKQLIETFKTELQEQSQTITNGLLTLEQNNISNTQRDQTINEIFRAAHNIKGTSRSLGIENIGDITHHLESIFSGFKQKTLSVSPPIIDLCLEAVDKLDSAMSAFTEKTSLTFDIKELLTRLASVNPTTSNGTQQRKATPASTSSSETTSKKNIEPKSTETIRVGVNNIDKISSQMEELQLNKIAIEDQYTELTKLANKTKQFSEIWRHILTQVKNSPNSINDTIQRLIHAGADNIIEINTTMHDLHKNLRTQLNELTVHSNSIQDELRLLRLVPAANLFGTMPRYVHDLSRELNKKVELKITGDQVKMDKMVLESLKDPIIHIIRNSIDHGIESPEVRIAKGKPETGLITIVITEDHSQIRISISDDGQGIDINKVAETAINNNLLSKSELNSMSMQEITDLIFRSGVSTKQIITDVSGRGVGLDVVKVNIANINGHVNVKTEANTGTTFELRVPLTLSSERGLLVRCNNQLFVLPTNSLVRIMNIHSQDIIEVEGSQAILVDKHSVPLHSLINVLSLEQDNQSNFLPKDILTVIVLQSGWNTIALLVDEIMVEREIVIKPLQSLLANIPCIAGGTLSGTNQVIIVLNPADIINTALHISNPTKIIIQDTTVKTIIPHILVVDDSITTRTLEKNILESNNFKVTAAVNGKEAWELLQKQTFSLLITDVVMPEMDGFTLTEHVKHNEKLRSMPVIIVTSLGSDAEKKRGIEVGADAYIVKNQFESGALLEIVEQLI